MAGRFANRDLSYSFPTSSNTCPWMFSFLPRVPSSKRTPWFSCTLQLLAGPPLLPSSPPIIFPRTGTSSEWTSDGRRCPVLIHCPSPPSGLPAVCAAHVCGGQPCVNSRIAAVQAVEWVSDWQAGSCAAHAASAHASLERRWL